MKIVQRMQLTCTLGEDDLDGDNPKLKSLSLVTVSCRHQRS